MPKPVCSCCVGLNMVVSKENRSKGMIIPMRCKTWKCPECGCDLRKKWRERAAATFETAAAWETTVCSDDEFDSFSRRVRRIGEYYRIRSGDVSYVFHTPLPKTRQHTPDESKWLSPAQALAEFTAVLDRLDISRVSSSRHLKRTAPATSVWKRESIQRKSVGEVNHFLESLKINSKIVTRKTFNGRLIDVILLKDFPDLKEMSCPSSSKYSRHQAVLPKNRQSRKTRKE